MLGFLSSLSQMHSQAKTYKHQGKLFSIQANAARKQARAQAALIEFAGQQNHEIANANLRIARQNQRADVGTARALQATSGFTSQDSGSDRARRTQALLDAEIENMALSASISSLNAWQHARDTIKRGIIQGMQLDAKADQMNRAAKATRESMLLTGISSAVGAIAKAASGALGVAKDARAAQTINQTATTAYKQGQFGQVGSQSALTEYQSVLQPTPGISDYFSAAFTGAYNGLNTFSGAANAFNPYTATMTPAANNRKNNWGSNLSILLGRTPYTTPQAGNLFSFF